MSLLNKKRVRHLLVFGITSVLVAKGSAQTLQLVNGFDSQTDLANLSTKFANVSLSTSPVLQGTGSLKVNYLPAGTAVYSSVELKLPTPVSLVNTAGLSFDFVNPGSRPISIAVSMLDVNGKARGYSNLRLEPNHFCTYLLTLGEDPKDLFLRFTPAPYYHVRNVEATGSGVFDPSKIVKIRIFQKYLSEGNTVHIDNIRTLREVSVASRVNNMSDKYGQHGRLLSNWHNKVFTDADLALRKLEEDADLAANPPVSGRSAYGGWLSGPRQTATGFFYTKKVNGKWWFVDPAGYLYFNHAIDSVNWDNDTQVTAREHMFQWLPSSSDPLSENLKWATDLLYYPGKSGYTMNFYTANLQRKYGSNYRNLFAPRAMQRIQSWGFNGLGHGYYPSLFTGNGKLPYTTTLHFKGNFKTIHSGYLTYGPLPDPYDPTFAPAVRDSLLPQVQQYLNDPWLIGYYIENEPSFAGAGEEDGRYGLAYGAMKQHVSNQPSKAVFIDQLQARYGTIGALNVAWGTSFSSWTALEPGISLPSPTTGPAMRADMQKFVLTVAREYFTVIRNALNSVDPNHLYMGCRFVRYTTEAIQASTEVADVSSINIHDYAITADRFPMFDMADKPWIIPEFSFSAVDRGASTWMNVPVRWQKNRAEKFVDYFRAAADHPNIIGVQYYKYADTPVTGTKEGHGGNIGFVDICDTPYPEMVNAARRMGKEMYIRRGG